MKTLIAGILISFSLISFDSDAKEVRKGLTPDVWITYEVKDD